MSQQTAYWCFRQSRFHVVRFAVAVLCAVALSLSMLPPTSALAAGSVPAAAQKAYDETGAYLAKQTPAYGSDWVVMGLARAGYAVPATYYSTYNASVEQTVKAKEGVLHAKKYSEYARVAIGLSAAGLDPAKVAGYNLLAPLGDYDQVIWQGINGPAWALIALDTRGYAIPAAPAGKTQAAREGEHGYVDYILAQQHADGGWSLSSAYESSDVDITAMVMTALAPYVGKRADVKAAVDKGVAWLSKAQLANGGFASSGMGTSSETSESAAQAIVALCSLGIDPSADTRFIKNGKSAIDALAAFAVSGGGFKHLASGSLDALATEQGYYALVAYMRLKSGKSRLYDFADNSARTVVKKATAITVNVTTVSASTVSKAAKKAGTDVASIKTITLGAKVKKIKAKAFAKCKKATKLIVKTTKLVKKKCKNCLKGSKIKTVQVKVAKKKLAKTKKAYKKIFVKKVAGKKATVK